MTTCKTAATMTLGWHADTGRRYVLGKTIGRGQYGTVFKARDTILDRDVAIKRIPMPHTSDEKRQIIHEANACERVSKFRNSVAFYDAYEDGHRAYIVTEFVDGAPIPVEKTSEMETRRIIRNVLYFVDGCHSVDIIHRDVKPQNFVYNSRVFKGLDMGASIRVHDPIPTMIGTPLYMPPEAVLSNTYEKAYDLWSVGVMTFQLLTGHHPYLHPPYTTSMRDIFGGETTSFARSVTSHLETHRASASAIDFVSRLLNVDPRDRGTAWGHPWLRE